MKRVEAHQTERETEGAGDSIGKNVDRFSSSVISPTRRKARERAGPREEERTLQRHLREGRVQSR